MEANKPFFERCAEATALFLADPSLPYVSEGGVADIVHTYVVLFVHNQGEIPLMSEYMLGAWEARKGNIVDRDWVALNDSGGGEVREALEKMIKMLEVSA